MSEKDSPFSHCLMFTSNALARVLSRMADEAFGEFGMSYSHAFIILHVVKKPGLPIGELSDVLLLSPSTVTRLAEKLEKSGYLKRESKGRSNQIFPTPKAKKIALSLDDSWKRVMNIYSRELGKESATKLTNKIYKATKKLSEL